MDGTMIELRNFSTGYGTRRLLEGVDADFAPGSLTALLGRNGAGKSTLLRAMAGLGEHEGLMKVGGRPTDELDSREAARLLSFVSTERTRISAMKCRDIVGMGRAPYTGWMGSLSENDRRIVGDALDAVGMSGFADRSSDTLSDGECQRLMIARALAQDTPAMLLDEPTSFLDLPNRYELCTLLRELAHSRGKCIIFSTHELDIAIALSDRIALIDPPSLLCDDTEGMVASGHIARLFDPDGRIPAELWNIRRPELEGPGR